MQRAVDRRFNRTRYDAEAVVAAFTARMRQTIDLDTIQAISPVSSIKRSSPPHASLWLPNAPRTPPKPPPGRAQTDRRLGSGPGMAR